MSGNGLKLSIGGEILADSGLSKVTAARFFTALTGHGGVTVESQ